MAEDKQEKAGKSGRVESETAQNMHKTFLEALRHREQEILRFMAILAPALGGFVWLLRLDDAQASNLYVFGVGTIGVLFLLVIGSVYSLALGYNYRCITLQVAKLEGTCLGIREFILKYWPRKRDDFLKRYKVFCKIPYCAPPEIIKVFWWAFNVGIVGVTVSGAIRLLTAEWKGVAMVIWVIAIIVVGIICEFAGLLMPIQYGCKLKKVCEEEPAEWKSPEIQKMK